MMDELWKRKAPNHLLYRNPDKSPELHVINSMFWYSIEDHASAIRVEPNQNGALIQFRVDDVFQDKCEIGEDLLALLMHRFKLMLFPDNTIHIVISDNRYKLNFNKAPTDFG